ncbi:hypothetical protein BKA67DRAFT_652916 [Truncatella angustata]|uniref:Secreted protein n=1 Tax=Truncatella angustata TaxID=152316 RepID=A0A9P8UWV1_9PEZI|nr:uncharacterized protein BKA67DRAFT_652916 [Truncatella angustata]KAH6659692.1 hypothetical protein BKA67DRAFT_652916 [Truncatella angustata]
MPMHSSALALGALVTRTAASERREPGSSRGSMQRGAEQQQQQPQTKLALQHPWRAPFCHGRTEYSRIIWRFRGPNQTRPLFTLVPRVVKVNDISNPLDTRKPTTTTRPI